MNLTHIPFGPFHIGTLCIGNKNLAKFLRILRKYPKIAKNSLKNFLALTGERFTKLEGSPILFYNSTSFLVNQGFAYT